MKHILLSQKFIIPAVVIAMIYMAITTWLMNARLFVSTVLGDYSFSYKYKLLTALLGGMWTAMSETGLIMLVIVAMLTGANLTLIVQRIVKLRSFGKLQFVAGGSSLLGFIGSGCAACGLPILAFLGLGGSIAYLPLRGMELPFISAILLLISLYMMIKTSSQKEVCEIPVKSNSTINGIRTKTTINQ